MTKIVLVASLARFVVLPLAAYVLAAVLGERSRPCWTTYALAAGTVLVGLGAIAIVVDDVAVVRPWDFPDFWLYARVGLSQANVYDPAVYTGLTVPVPTDADFRTEVLDVGFPYPPPTMLLFAPLGLLPIHAASAVWMAYVVATLAAAVAVLAKPFGRAALLPIAGLVLALPATYDDLAHQQTVGFGLALVAATLAFGSRPLAGAAAAVAAIVKPYLAVAVLWLALRRRSAAALSALGTLAAATVVALPFVGGPAGLATYLARNPATRMPPNVFSEDRASSLYAVLLRARGGAGSVAGAAHDPLFLTLAVLLALATLWLVVRSSRSSPEDGALGLGLTIAAACLVYPGTSAMALLCLVPAGIALVRLAPAGREAAVALVALGLGAASAAGGTGACAATLALYAMLAAALARRRAAERSP